ncbi:MAG: hypothetical protein GWN00_22265, partial [Aliifodinibius sp.]|nr:hypothetical protein [candidate division Zixibacteria bacterium]NIT58845.1 hypothetical protein [Fodinibius sp.]NIW46548.1 hypothetical protein [Gammaproteobacteria bacterium]NIS47149.1 hypothetical protein [candidate division Zixibacteria bacterium]NIU15286.1 hypothetical protein [candidate division Zixibacteria bacterium]
MNSLSFRSILLLILVYIFQTFSQDVSPFTEQLSVEFAGKYGQLEIGGNFVGAEFHHSLPLPSRISFYYPVANSIDLSTDYWQRDQSHPFSVTLNFDGEVREIGKEPFRYRYTP